MKGDRGTEYLWIGYKKCKEFLKEEAIWIRVKYLKRSNKNLKEHLSHPGKMKKFQNKARLLMTTINQNKK